MDKLKDDNMTNEMISVFAHEDNSSLLSDYLSDMNILETGQIDALSELGGIDTDIFLQSILQNWRKRTEASNFFLFKTFQIVQ